MQAFHNDPAIKEFYLARIRAHQAADEIIHGQYWKNGKGCAVGCSVHSGDHKAYELELGIPRIVARLEDGIFERLRSPDDIPWPEQFLLSISVGADLSMVWPQFAVLLLADDKYGVLRHVQQNEYCREKRVIERVVELYRSWIASGVRPAADAADAAADAAYAARRQEITRWQAQTLLRLLVEAPVPATMNL